MDGLTLLLVSTAVFFIAYVTYGSWLAKQWGIDPKHVTPAVTKNDGIDYMPAKPAVLLGHHFSSIAGAGPIVGPITAAVFGWIPVVLWIVVGSIFFGGVHDYGSLVASIRHNGQSIGQIINKNIGNRARLLFAIFAWITLLVVIAAFANIVAVTFVANPSAGTTSLLFILVAIAFGFGVYRTGLNLVIGSILGLIAMGLCFYLGHIFPLAMSKQAWLLLLMAYIFVASIAPVWILLQPRDFLNSFLLYGMIVAAFVGVCVYQPEMHLAGFAGFDLGGGNWLFPVLFITVACGAISGFHSLVSSGTSSKQLDNEKNAKLIGYGSMLIEGLLAVIAVISVCFVAADKLPALLKAGGPVNAFSDGVATFMTALGFEHAFAKEFLALTISAFALTTLDTATRLARFILQETIAPNATHIESSSATYQARKVLSNRYVATLVTIALAWLLSTGSYLTIWPIFGTANQLLAALALLAIAAWLKREGRNTLMVTIPMCFMFAVTLSSLVQLIYFNIGKNWTTVSLAVFLAALSVGLAAETYRVFSRDKALGNLHFNAQQQQQE